jgi:hypothetical protein
MRRPLRVFAVAVAITLVVSFLAWWYYVDLLALRVRASALYEWWAGDVMDRNLRKYAGWRALQCGTVGVVSDRDKAKNCALSAVRSERPFYVRYQVRGIDSRIGVGIAVRSTREAYFLQYDSIAWSKEGLAPNEQLIEGGHLLVEPCPTPLQLWETPHGRLSCFPSDDLRGYGY